MAGLGARQRVTILVALLLSSAVVGATDFTTPEIPIEPTPPAVGALESRVVISGVIGGEVIEDEWDFSQVDGGPTTNGVMNSQISSSVPGSASLYFDNDFTPATGVRPQSADEWYYRFTLGNAKAEYSLYNAKDSFAIPPGPYAMITVRKGPRGEELRHREFSGDNLITGIVSEWDYTPDARTLRVEGSFEARWSESGDWIRFDFSVLYGGPDDRMARFNRSTMRYSF